MVEIFAQTTGGVDPLWIIVPSVLTFLLGLITWNTNRSARKREQRQRDLELAIHKEETDVGKLKALLDGYEERMESVSNTNTQLSNDLIETQKEVLDLRTEIGKLQVRLHELEAEIRNCHAERDILKAKVVELEDALGG